MIDREVIVPPTMQRVVERAGYAPAVRVGATVYCAGQVGRTPELDVIADPEAQFLACWDNLRTVLEAAGCTFDDVVDATVFLVDPEATFERIWEIVPEYWGDAPHPTLTAVGVTWLYGFQFEIKVIARLPETVDG